MEHKGTVYFFTGLSGAGKTTLGGLFYQRLKATKPNVVYLDGDAIRPIFGEDSGYTQDDRLRWAGRIFRVCKMLADQGIDVICCSIAMFSSVRRWNRENISQYKEIYIRVKKETLLARNQKGLYTAGCNVVGVDIPFDEPQSSDLVVQNDGEQTPQELVEQIEHILYPNIVENPIDNRDYWNRYYQDQICTIEPSPFARYVATMTGAGGRLVDLGCGNGRDALFFADIGLDVVAIDLSDAAIRMLQKLERGNPHFICGDIIKESVHQSKSYDYAYSRFTIHAINSKQEQLLLRSMYRALKPGGKFFIEVRGIHDPLYGKGQQQERNAFFYNNHYRRFIVMDELVAALRKIGFRVEYAQERTGFAPYGNDDPPVIRIVAIRQEG